MEYVIGLDLGTGSIKGIALDKAGEVVLKHSESYPLYNNRDRHSEQEPEDWYNASVKVLEKITNDLGGDGLRAISISGQMHSLVLLDNENKPIRRSILWNDTRTTKQCEYIMNNFGEKVIEITGNKSLEGFTLPKVLWVKENEPENWEKTKKFCLPKDYLVFKYTGNICTDISDAAGTQMLNIKEGKWSEEIANLLDLDLNIYPKIYNSTECVGELNEELKEKLNAKGSIKIFPAGSDNPCSALGSGIINKNRDLLSIGTSGVYLKYEEEYKNYGGKLHMFNNVLPNSCYSMGVTLSAGDSLSWFRNTFAKDKDFDELLSGVSNVKEGSNGLLFAPYIVGERTPYADSNIRGTFIGIDKSHDLNHFARAVIEGITFSLKDCFSIYEDDSDREIISVGGGAKSKDWLQIQANVFNKKVISLKIEEGPSLGAAIIASVSLNWFDSFESAVKVIVKEKECYYPNEEAVKEYEEVYTRYRRVYESVKNI
ncbi:xylulokinase [Clostridium tertium]|uniref:xylulokinase n=1 Tax=Clostridium tertium TaxID=1559 RepID=UPI0018AABAA6|nr:xylulokinase [Clostridium tertium]MDB1971295.1 xylulokinase [Clostridium tertium]